MITILGASGFIGSNLVLEFERRHIKYFAPKRNENLNGKDLGNIIYCIGLTGDSKYKPHETVEAHITKLQEIITTTRFNSITYCSSTRVYINNLTANEVDYINVDVNDDFELFNLTKLTAESLLKNTVKNYKIVRLSNVFGYDFLSNNFLTSIVKDVIINKKVELRTTPYSSKDYVFIEDVTKILFQIANSNSTGIFNIGFGENTTNEIISKKLVELTGTRIIYSNLSKDVLFPQINTDRIKKEFGYSPTLSIVEFLPDFIENFKNFI